MKKLIIYIPVLVLIYFLYKGYKDGVFSQAPTLPKTGTPRNSPQSGPGNNIPPQTAEGNTGDIPIFFPGKQQ